MNPRYDVDTERAVATSIVRTLRNAGHSAYFVGGCVREMLLGEEPHDHDVATDAVPDRIAELFGKTVHVGAKFGVVTVIERGVHVEVATFRTDGGYADGRRPDEVTYSGPAEDVARRDFTINALLYDPIGGEVVDHVGGRADLTAGIIRTVGEPGKRFAEDHLRLLRAVRFSARLGFRIEEGSWRALCAHAHLIGSVSAERVREELTRMFMHRTRAKALRMLDKSGLLAHVLPEVQALHGVEQPVNYHPEGDVFRHVVLAMEALPLHVTEAVAWATLLHDIGKPRTAVNDGRIRFHGHDVVGAAMADALLDRLRFSNATRERVVELVRRHLHPRDAPNMRRATLRKLLADPCLEELLVVCRADALGGSGDVSHVEFLESAREEMGDELPPPLVSGKDLQEAGLAPGPAYARILGQVRDDQLEGRILDREGALVRMMELVASEV